MSDWYGYGFYGGSEWDDGPVNRRCWSDKSSAALARENEAKKLVKQFLIRAKDSASKNSVIFPLTEEIICPTIHLTSKCYTDFRKFVIERKGCKVKRREISHSEKMMLRPKSKIRKCKMYAISVTIPVHPDDLRRSKEEERAKAAAAVARKEEKAKEKREKAKREAEEMKKKAAEMKILVENDYAKVVAFVDGKGKHSDEENHRNQEAPIDKNAKKRAFGDEISVEVNRNCTEGSTKQTSPRKKTKVANGSENAVKLVAPQSGLIYHADRVYHEKLNQITLDMHIEKMNEKRLMLEELDKKMTAKTDKAKKEATEYCDSIKKVIKALMSTTSPTIDQPKESAISTKTILSAAQIAQVATLAASFDQTKETATSSEPNPGSTDTSAAISTVHLAQ